MSGDREKPSSWRLVNDKIYFLYPRRLVSLDTSGTEKWSFQLRDHSVLFDPDFSKSLVFISSSSGRTYALNKETGTMKWFIDLNRPILSPTLLFRKGLYVVIGSKSQAQLARIHPRSGKLKWVSEYRFPFDGHLMTPQLYLGYIIVSGGEKVFALSGDKGQLVWSASSQGELGEGRAVVNQAIYLVSKQGLILALKARTGNKIWEFDLKQPVTLALVHGGVAAMGQDSQLYFFDRKSGQKRWTFKMDSPQSFVTSVRLSSRVIREEWSLWSPCGRHHLCVLNSKNGQVLGRISLQGVPSSPPYFFGKGFFIGLNQPQSLQEDKKMNEEMEPVSWAIVKMAKGRASSSTKKGKSLR